MAERKKDTTRRTTALVGYKTHGTVASARDLVEYPGQRSFSDWVNGKADNREPRNEPKTVGGKPNPVRPGPDKNDVRPSNGLLNPDLPNIGYGLRVVEGRLPRNRPTDEWIREHLRAHAEASPVEMGGARYKHACRTHWVPYDDMPWWLLRRVLSGKICGAKLVHKDKEYALEMGFPPYCQRKPYQFGKHRALPFRCACHGGNAGGTPHGVPRALKSGLYASCLLNGEEDKLNEITITNLDDEIVMVKLRLARALEGEARWHEAIANKDEGYLRENAILNKQTDKIGTAGYGGHIGEQTNTYIAPDWGHIVHSLINQLCKLQMHKYTIEGGESNTKSPEERAQFAQRFLREAKLVAQGKDPSQAGGAATSG